MNQLEMSLQGDDNWKPDPVLDLSFDRSGMMWAEYFALTVMARRQGYPWMYRGAAKEQEMPGADLPEFECIAQIQENER